MTHSQLLADRWSVEPRAEGQSPAPPARRTDCESAPVVETTAWRIYVDQSTDMQASSTPGALQRWLELHGHAK